jgi:sugar phosphate permease
MLTRPRIYYGWLMVGGLSLTELISWGVLVYAFGVLLVPMHRELGASIAELNAAYAIGIVVSGVMAIPVGKWMQANGTRSLMTVGSVLTALVLLGWSEVDSIEVFFGLFAFAGLAMAATLYEPAFAVTATWFDARRSRAVLLLTVFGGLASVVFVPLTGVLTEHLGWRETLLVLAAVVALVCIPVHGLVLRRWPSDHGLTPDGASEPVEKPAATSGLERAAVVRTRSFRWITACLVLSTMSKVAVTVILVAYLTERGYPLPTAALASGAVGLFQVTGRVLLTWLSRHLPVHVATVVIFVAQAFGFLLPLLTTGSGTQATVSVWVFVVLFGLGFGLPELLRGTLVADYYGAAHYADINGTLATFVIAARAAGPFLSGVAVTVVGYPPAFIGAAALALAGAGALVVAHRAHTEETSG